ncbi:hypothetical protein PRUPE_3G009300 [Prunus persica]|uniref:Uncharacterized protein n=1 Tax=Prunus persica TaxID=3760 RepID=A0A251PTA9_PRUPE|nr:hypothetical protein PRUPE_3G009300 [Prunus persica]
MKDRKWKLLSKRRLMLLCAGRYESLLHRVSRT